MAKCSRLVKILVWVGLGMAAAVALGWWLARFLREEEETEEAVWTPPQRPLEVSIPLPFLAEDEDEEAPAPQNEDEPAEPDSVGGLVDFTRIDGVGPKYAEGLVASGITSFEQLSEQDPEHLAEALRTHGLRIIGDRIVQDDWIGQARRLAAEG